MPQASTHSAWKPARSSGGVIRALWSRSTSGRAWTDKIAWASDAGSAVRNGMPQPAVFSAMPPMSEAIMGVTAARASWITTGLFSHHTEGMTIQP